MPKIVFWSPYQNMTGSTHTAVAVSTLMGITHKISSLLMQTNLNSHKMEAAFTPYDELMQSKVFESSSIGINPLIRLIASNKLTPDSIQNYAKPVLKERLDVLYGMNSDDMDAYNHLINNLTYMIRRADEIYDLVFVDMLKSIENKGVMDTLADADMVVCVINQDTVKFYDFFNIISTNEILKDKDKIVVIADYEANSKYNLFNLKFKYKIKDSVFTIPHNYMFADACNSGSVIDFFYRNINADSRDYNGNFIAHTLEIVKAIIDITKIKEG